jgi:dolichol kinase
MDEELKRQVFHIAVGVGSIAFLLLFGRGYFIGAVFFTIVIGMLLINARLLGKKISLVQWFEKHFERPDVMFPGWGSACYAAGALIPATFLTDVPQIAAIIFILAIGDGFSTAVGRLGRVKLPYNSKKTLEGTIAFLIASLPAYYFVGPAVLPLAVVGMIVESIDFRIDDNLAIPIACTALLLVM